jgi:hypothetical protein
MSSHGRDMLFERMKASASMAVTSAIMEYRDGLKEEERMGFLRKLEPYQDQLHTEVAEARLPSREEEKKYALKRIDEIYKSS